MVIAGVFSFEHCYPNSLPAVTTFPADAVFSHPSMLTCYKMIQALQKFPLKRNFE